MECEEIQLAVVNGRALERAELDHCDACAECRFLAELSRQLGDTGPAAPVLDPGALLGRYRVEGLRGSGGQGSVHRAIELETGEPVAVKLVHATGNSAAEASNARRVRHPNVCGVYHTERHGAVRLIVMEWIDGPTLAERRARLRREEALALFRGICAGVAAAHGAGVLHLDLKPGNILIRAGEPVVTDFGLSVRIIEDTAVATGGTPRYMAPEQATTGTVDRRTDVFALGRILEDLVPDPTPRLRRAISRATDPVPDRRFVDVPALAAAIEPARRRVVRRIAIATAAVSIALAVVYLAIPPPRGPRAIWYASAWGADLVPAEAWNVAQAPHGRVEVESPMWGCAQRPEELLDGIAQYGNWEHGVGFLPAPDPERLAFVCVPLAWMGRCDTLRDDDPLCEFDADGRHYHAIDGRGREVPAMPATALPLLGKAVTRVPCGERAVIIHLDDTYEVFAVRIWHHGAQHTPHEFRIELRDGGDPPHVTVSHDDIQGMRVRDYEIPGTTAGSAPVTTMFAPVPARDVRYVMNTCSTVDDERTRYRLGEHAHPMTGTPHGHGWLYEVEVFARLSRREAWSRYLDGE